MEGFACSEAGCRTRDFLPFLCNVCNGLFCLEHRSCSAHNCAESSCNRDSHAVSSPQASSSGSVSAMFDAVATRHDIMEGNAANPKTHAAPVKGSLGTSVKGQLNEATISKVDKLRSSSSLRARDVNINKATTKILLKSKAGGNKSIPVEMRVYLQLTFPASKVRVVHFFSKRSAVSEALQLVANTMETAAFGSADRSASALVMYSNAQSTAGAAGDEDALTSWANWDSRLSLETFFPDDRSGCHSDVEDVCVIAVPIAAVLEKQHKFEALSRAAAVPVSQSVTGPLFRKGQRVLYRRARDGDVPDAPEVLEEAVVRGVHVDGDGDDTYYTVYFPHSQQERQTVAARLSAAGPEPRPGPADGATAVVPQSPTPPVVEPVSIFASSSNSTALDGPGPCELLLVLLHKNLPTEIALAPALVPRTVAQLKAQVAAHPRCSAELSRALGSKACKLLCKGKMLKDPDDFSKFMPAGAKGTVKIMVIGG
jgi:hypothetical protein